MQNTLTHYTLGTASRPSAAAASSSAVQPPTCDGQLGLGPQYAVTPDGQPVVVTLNPYSTQLVDNINRMMGPPVVAEENLYQLYGTAMNPQLAKLTATLRKKRCESRHPGPCRHPPYSVVNIHENGMVADGHQPVSTVPSGVVDTSEVVFRAVSPHGHVYWEIDPTRPEKARSIVVGKSQLSSSDENTNSDLQNVSDMSDDDQRASSEMSRQSSSR